MSLSLYEGGVKRGVFDGNMFYYIQALHLSKTHNALLLELLKDWRLNADHQEIRLLEIELQLRFTLESGKNLLKWLGSCMKWYLLQRTYMLPIFIFW